MWKMQLVLRTPFLLYTVKTVYEALFLLRTIFAMYFYYVFLLRIFTMYTVKMDGFGSGSKSHRQERKNKNTKKHAISLQSIPQLYVTF